MRPPSVRAGLFLILLVIILGCTQGPTLSRSGDYVQVKPKVESSGDQDIEDNTDDNEEEETDELRDENLPEYLFSLSKAQQITEVMEAYIPTSLDMFEGAVASATREELRTYFQIFIGTAHV